MTQPEEVKDGRLDIMDVDAVFQADLAAFGAQSPELAKRYRAV